MSIGKWIGNWVGRWFGRSDDSALHGSGSITSSNWTATLDVLVRVIDAVPPEPTLQSGSGQQATSRNSDPDAYRSDRVSNRLKSVVIAGREYDPFDPLLLDRLHEYAAMPEPEQDDEAQRQAAKLARSFTVNTGNQSISVPVFRPMLQQIPDFKQASCDDFKQFAEQASGAAREEYRRVVLLLLATDW